MFHLLRNHQIIGTVAAPLTFPPVVPEASNFYTSSPALVISCFCKHGHPRRCEMLAHGGCDLHLPRDNAVGYLFMREILLIL